MGRRAAPYTVYPDPRTGLAWINTSIAGKRARKPLGIVFAPDDGGGQEHERRLAAKASEVYAALIQGRSLSHEPSARVQTSSTLHELLSQWLVEDGRTYPASAKLSITHASHWETFAEDDFRGFAGKDPSPRWKGDKRTPLERLTAGEGTSDYVRERLRVVLKDTIVKEVSTLFRFFVWCVERRALADEPPRPKYPKKAVGVRSGPQRATPVQTTHEETLAIIAAMPEWTARGGRNHGQKTAKAIPVRDLARLAYETGLRPSTIGRLSAPEHFVKGERRLWIPPEIDKGRNKARYVGLSKVAYEIVMRHHKDGVMFGRHDLRVQWKRAAAQVLPAARAKAFSVYDFRHAAGRRMVQASGGNLLGVAHQLGHTQLTTTNRYLAPAEQHGDAVVAALDAKSTRRANRLKREARA